MTRFRSPMLGVPAALALALGLVGAACTDDNPQTELPCEFYFNQRDSGVDVDVPEECEDEAPPEAPAGTPGSNLPD